MTKISMNSGLTLTPADASLTEFIVAATQARMNRNKFVEFTFLPQLKTVKTLLYWGVFSWQIPSERQRWLVKSALLKIGNLPLTPGDLVRDYLDFYHPKPLRAIGSEARLYEQSISAPLLVSPQFMQDASYIDIQSAYWSIVKMVGWNVGYYQNEWLTPGRAPLDFPYPEHKGARNYLVSIGLPSVISIWTGYRMIHKSGHNVHINRGLWRVVMDILHSIASFAEALGATYIHTDGYIIPSNMYEELSAYINSFGLNGRLIASGEAVIMGFGNYLVGDKKTKSFDASRPGMAYRYILPTPAAWLQTTLSQVRKRGYPTRLYEQSIR